MVEGVDGTTELTSPVVEIVRGPSDLEFEIWIFGHDQGLVEVGGHDGRQEVVIELRALTALTYFVGHGEENVTTGIVVVVVGVVPGETMTDVDVDLGGRDHGFVGRGMFEIGGGAAGGGTEK